MTVRRNSDVKFLRIADVCDRVGLSRPEIYRRMKAGRFPRPIKIGERAVAWSSDAISRWQVDMELIG